MAQQPQDPFAEAQEPLAPVTRDVTERIAGMERDTQSPLYRALAQHHAERVAQAQMYQKNAAEALGILHYGKNPQTGADLTQDELDKYNAQANYAVEQYGKLIGVNKEAKGALDKARTIIDFIRGQRGGQMGAPPSPQDQAREQAYQQRIGQVRQALTSPFVQQGANVNIGIDKEGRQLQAGIDQRTAAVKKVYGEDVDMSEPAIQDYILTGRIAGGALTSPFQQATKYIEDKDGRVLPAIFNKRTGKYLNAETHEEIEGGRLISPSDLAAHSINVMFPEGPRVIIRRGDKFSDTHGNLLDGEIVPLQRGMIPTYSEHEMPGQLADGTPVKFVMRRVTTPQIGNIPSPYAGGAAPTAPAGVAPTGAAAPAGGGAVPQARGGQLTPAPTPQAGGAAPKAGGGRQRTGGGLGGPLTVGGQMAFTAPMFKDQSTKATGIDQARNSLVGDDIEKGVVGGLAKDLDVFKDPDAVKRIGAYLQLVHNLVAREGDSYAANGDNVGAFKWFLGMPTMVIGLQQGALKDQYDKLTANDKRFVADYFRTMGTMGGMRSSTGMPAYQWAFTNMYSEMPTPGQVYDYDDAVHRTMNYVNETNVVAKRNKMVSKVDIADTERKIRGGRMSAAPPPGASTAGPPKTSDEYLKSIGIAPKKP